MEAEMFSFSFFSLQARFRKIMKPPLKKDGDAPLLPESLSRQS
jgi:hypothetical protein